MPSASSKYCIYHYSFVLTANQSFSEEDAGILHKHTDFRTNKAQVARNRKLIISSICTVANYEVSQELLFCPRPC